MVRIHSKNWELLESEHLGSPFGWRGRCKGENVDVKCAIL